jgi:3-phenylpropionate/trans-cinnamate dioxygenase ferredoxin component
VKFVKVAKTSDVPDDAALQVKVNGSEVALVRCEGEIYAVSDICSHELAYLSEGFVEDCTIECPLHGSSFDVRTGKVLSLPAAEDIATYQVRIEGDYVLVGIEE